MAKERLRFRGVPGNPFQKDSGKVRIRPKITDTRTETAVAVGEAVEAFAPQAEIKGLLCEMYDKVNVAVLLYKEQQDRGIDTPVAFKLERLKMLKRFLRELHELGATQHDYAKFFAMWNGDIDPKNLGEYQASARDVKVAFELQLDLDPILQELDPMKALSAPEDFANAAKAQWGTYREDKRNIDFSIRRGFPMTYGLYMKIMDYVALDPEHAVHPGRLAARGARELADLSALYKGYGHDGYMTSGLFEKVAAIFLHLYKSSFVNAFNDQYIRKICRMILEGATEGQFLSEIRRLGPFPRRLF